MAAFAEFFYSGKSFLLRYFMLAVTFLRSVVFDGERGRKCAKIIMNTDVDFYQVSVDQAYM
jgi:hypothetical protein